MLMKLTGQDTKQKVSGEVLHHHTVAPASPLQRAMIQSSTLMFSPKPGHMNLPLWSFRNQLT